MQINGKGMVFPSKFRGKKTGNNVTLRYEISDQSFELLPYI